MPGDKSTGCTLPQLAMTYYAMAKLREPTELGWSRLAGFLYDLEGASRETQILGHTQALLPDDVRQHFELNAEITRQGFFKEDAVFNAAIAEWDLRNSKNSFVQGFRVACVQGSRGFG